MKVVGKKKEMSEKIDSSKRGMLFFRGRESN
jgi:hypothetical protein